VRRFRKRSRCTKHPAARVYLYQEHRSDRLQGVTRGLYTKRSSRRGRVQYGIKLASCLLSAGCCWTAHAAGDRQERTPGAQDCAVGPALPLGLGKAGRGANKGPRAALQWRSFPRAPICRPGPGRQNPGPVRNFKTRPYFTRQI
jgi:hypothetical protein